ncbi:redoxin domain-containing protein [uncultured Enterovirga sp.]|uniref:redoxin domain-containing protein n=1 Tax=uncultured Enterovirga sp. TaxID=2026352 RepID=UPI0035CBB0EA
MSHAQPQAGPQIGAAAPNFTATDANGRKVSLADYKGKTVVLEWTNDECPFVKKHYSSQNMQALQKKWTGKDVVWLTLISSPPGEQGYADAAKANKLTADRGAAPTAVVLDPAGDVGRTFKAQVTPHMYVVKPNGVLAYMGGIDDKPSSKVEDVKGAKNFVDAALTELSEGKPVSTTTARPYGCTVKFTS